MKKKRIKGNYKIFGLNGSIVGVTFFIEILTKAREGQAWLREFSFRHVKLKFLYHIEVEIMAWQLDIGIYSSE